MPKLVGVRERRHQPYWDTLIRADTGAAANPVVANQTRLFNGTNLGQNFWTNMTAAGVFPSDNTYIVLAIRVWMWFINTAALTQYQLCAHQLYITLTVGDKPQFQSQAWYFPSGGGIFGFDSTTPAMVNGSPSQTAILKLAKPIPIPARQSFYVVADLYDTGNTTLRTTYFNATHASLREVKVFLDGIHTRDVL